MVRFELGGVLIQNHTSAYPRLHLQFEAAYFWWRWSADPKSLTTMIHYMRFPI